MKSVRSNIFYIFTIASLLASVFSGAVTVTPARAASIVVNTNADNVVVDGLCTLREAITNANNNAVTNPDCTAGFGADTITFAGDYTITLTSQLPDVTSTITINGNGATKTIIQASTCNPVTLPGGCTPATYRVFVVANGGNLTLDKLSVQHGKTTGNGGGVSIDFGGTLTVTNSTFSNNTATNFGGGIFNNGDTLTVTNSVFSGNRAGSGGGIAGINGALNVTDSTFSGNNTSAGDGGGIFNNSNTLTVTNSTLSGNNAVGGGGGIYNSGNLLTVTKSTLSGNHAGGGGGGIFNTNSTLTVTNSAITGNDAVGNGGGIYNSTFLSTNLTNSTLSGNTASIQGGGMFNNNSTLTVTNSTLSGNGAVGGGGGIFKNANGTLNYLNTIIANSTSGGDCINLGTLNTNTNNLVEDGSCSSAFSGDPALNALANNGGPTQTMSLQTGSTAIDAGNAATCAAAPVSGKDQRGVTRPQGAGCDIGAYETGPIIPVVTASNPSAGATLTSLSSITVVFNQDMLDNATSDGAENINNYILVERGTNGSFDTTSCNGGVVSDDVKQTISTASYSNAGFITTLTLASPLANGTYRLFVCGTTSIWSVAGLELNNGANDNTVDFTINGTVTTSDTTSGATLTSTTASSLPTTGFAPNKITTLPVQPVTLAYANLGDLWLEIPSLGVKSTIVGVPQNADKTWSVDWLGNDTGWLNGTAFPTWTGNSVLTAHVTNADGLDGPFAALKSLKYGDQIIVHMGGVKYVYEVRETKLSRPYSTSYAFESKQDASYITLVTCSGYNPLNESYLFRRVVRAVLVEVK